jgi:hypothetical protein
MMTPASAFLFALVPRARDREVDEILVPLSFGTFLRTYFVAVEETLFWHDDDDDSSLASWRRLRAPPAKGTRDPCTFP